MNPFKAASMHHFLDRWHGQHAAHFAGRSRHGFFGFGGDFAGHGFPGGGRGAGGLGPGRKLGSADLQLLLLALLAEKPAHGYELIKALDERSNGYYSPSPGMVYPALTYLDEIGHATAQAEGSKKLYSITEAGLTQLESQRAAVDTLLEQLSWIGRKMDHLRRAMGAAGPGADDLDADGRGLGTEIRKARRALKSALIEKAGAPAEEQRRIATILERAAAEIRGG